jgi:hypothetical protein
MSSFERLEKTPKSQNATKKPSISCRKAVSSNGPSIIVLSTLNIPVCSLRNKQVMNLPLVFKPKHLRRSGLQFLKINDSLPDQRQYL